MSIYKKQIPQNLWQLRWLDEFMSGHEGFIAGGALRSTLLGEKVKDIDIFFPNHDAFLDAVDYFNELSENHNSSDLAWNFKYRNSKVCAFQPEGKSFWVELNEALFGTPEEVLRQFDFSVSKMAYYKEEVPDEDATSTAPPDIVAWLRERGKDPEAPVSVEEPPTKIEYRILYHEDFFEHLMMRRLVLDENIPFPVSTWERYIALHSKGFRVVQ